MAGHSKWANIKHKKAAVDKQRGKIWTKLIREITVAAREGKTSDPNASPRLRLAVDKALGANMPKDTIEKACKRGSGETGAENYTEVRYEGYGPGGIAVIVDTMTDNVNRTVGEVRHAFTKHGGNLGTNGSVAFQFKKIGVMNFAPGVDEEKLMEAALEAGMDDMITYDDSFEILTSTDSFNDVAEALRNAGFILLESDIDYVPSLEVTPSEEDLASLKKMIDILENDDDVQKVYHNCAVSLDD